jgi:hypothetical protein
LGSFLIGLSSESFLGRAMGMGMGVFIEVDINVMVDADELVEEEVVADCSLLEAGGLL